MKRIFLIALLCILGFNAQSQTTLYVDSSVVVSGNGSAWSSAYKTLNEALVLANATGTATKFTINIAKGTYYPTGAQSSTNRDSSFHIKRGGIKLFGGYPTGGGTRNVTANPTLLSGDIGAVSDNSDNSYHVVIVTDIAANADSTLVDGLSIVAGNATGTGTKTYSTSHAIARNAGGGFYLVTIRPTSGTNVSYYGNQDRFIVNNCNISGNKAVKGGGVYDSLAYMTFSNTTIANDTATTGGAVYSYQSSPYIYYCNITGNVATDGGGLYNYRAGTPFRSGNQPQVVYCTLDGNMASSTNGKGGAIYNDVTQAADILISSCIFTNNRARLGGGVYTTNYDIGGPTVTSSTFTGNRADSAGGGIFAYFALSPSIISDDTFRNNSADKAGGGIYFWSDILSSPQAATVTRCVFTGDTAATGGGLYTKSWCLLSQSSFLGNVANNGGGLYNNASGEVRNLIFRGNIALSNGGGLYNNGTGYEYKSALFSGNKAVRGGAVYDTLAYASFTNCTLAGDTAALGNGIYHANNTATFLNSIIWEGATADGIYKKAGTNVAITYSNVQGGYTGTGNLSTDPQFLSLLAATYAPTTSGDYQVSGCSPVINSGLNSGSYTNLTDVAGRRRLIATTVDRGAYEYQDTVLATSTAICVGTTTQLSNANSGGTWTSSNTNIASVSNTGLVTGIAGGTVTITYTYNISPCGTATGGQREITVLAPQTLPAITGNSFLCENGTTTMAIATSGGTWSSSDPTVATINSAAYVTALKAGDTYITYTYVTSYGCTSIVTKLLTVKANPVVPPTTGNTTLCTQSTTLLSNTQSGGVWNSSNTSIATVSSGGLVTATSYATGTINITYTVTSNGCTTTDTHPITVNASPGVSNTTAPSYPVVLCQDETVTLSNATAGGAWSSKNPSVASVDAAGLVTGLGGGTSLISYTYTASNGCSSSKGVSVAINRKQVPSVSIAVLPATTVCAGTWVKFVAFPIDGGGNPAYRWWKNGNLVSNAYQSTFVDSMIANGDQIYCQLTSNAVCAPTGWVSSTPITISVNGLSSVLAPTNASQTNNNSSGLSINYTDNSCDLIANVSTNMANDLGPTTATTTIDPTITGFVKRFVEITPTNNLPATVKLFFLQSEFDDYNSAASPGHLLLPATPSDPAVNNIVIYQYHGLLSSGTTGPGGHYNGNNFTVIPTSGISKFWNAASGYWEISFPVSGFSGHFLTAESQVPLAIRLGDISAVNKEAINEVRWNTLTESAGDYFELERSTNGKDFVRIARIESSGTASGYIYVDAQPVAGTNYYRLRMFESNGRSGFSKVVTAAVKQGTFAMEVFPNPAKDLLNVTTHGAGSGSVLRLTDITGNVIRTVELTGSNAAINISSLASGIYFLKYTDDAQQRQTIRVVKE